MPEIEETILAPEPVGGQWLQGGPVSLSALRGQRVVLIDFWDYTCVNCIRTLPYVVQWHRRYVRDGLTVIGVHAPEFNFARQSEFVLQAVKTLRSSTRWCSTTTTSSGAPSPTASGRPST